ncbi:MAG: hypothetical protein ACI9Y1_001563 [Lentisphaeria bacterium]
MYKALDKQRSDVKRQLKTQLRNKHCASKANSKREEKIGTLTQSLPEVEQQLSETKKGAPACSH